MSGHSKWAQIKHKKAITDAKKSKIFGKMAVAISAAAKKGADPQDNPTLRMMIEKARSFNMSNDAIERAIKKGSGEIGDSQLEEVIYEAYGPAGIAIIIKAITDNKNRTVAEIKHILNINDGKLAEIGSVKWMFKERGIIVIAFSVKRLALSKDELEMASIDAGAEDFKWAVQGDEKYLEIFTKPEKLMEVKKSLEEKNIPIESASVDLIPKNEIEISDPEIKNKIEKLFEALDEQNEVGEIYSNFTSKAEPTTEAEKLQ